MDIRELDLADTEALAAAYVVECEARRHSREGWAPIGEAARLAAWRQAVGWSYRIVGAYEDGRLVGAGTSATADDTPETLWLDVSVLPDRQGCGVGERLLGALEATSPPGVRRFVASAYRPTASQLDDLVRLFAGPLGYARATSETVVELDLAAAALPEPVAPPGYAVATYVDGVPESLRPEVGVLKGLVDAQAPSGELGWEPTPVSPEAYARELDLWRRQGRTPIESVAIDTDGRVAAWTCLILSADGARPAQVEGTLVLAEHRGRRLGRAVKVASLHAARARGVARVRTSSDDENVWMRAVNADLGFVPVESEVLLQKRRGQAKA